MRRFLMAATILACARFHIGPSASAQSLDDLNLQVHGYATQGFIYSTNNNWNTTSSTDGSAAWTEAVLNVTAQPQPRLRIGVQAHYLLLGTMGNQITLDWAQADYKFSDHFGIRFGKVKTPVGLLNETQDIDPAQLWVLLPQSVYPIASRDSILTHYGGVLYGQTSLGEYFGKLEYRAYGGQTVIGRSDGYFQALRDGGFSAPNGSTGPLLGATLRWIVPVQGLMLGATESAQSSSGTITYGPYQGPFKTPTILAPHFFGRYERDRLMIAGEYTRLAVGSTIAFSGIPPIYTAFDQRSFYAMASYRVTGKLTGGLYYSSSIDRKVPTSSARYQKDWALAARYDFNQYLYAKFEQHFVDGTEIGYSTSNNANGLQPNTRMTMFKLGASF